MKKIQIVNKDYGSYRANRYDDMKNMLNISRRIQEQREFEVDVVDNIDIEKKREREKSQVHTVSAGKLITHGETAADLNLTDDEKTTYQETMDDFLEQVSDLVDYSPLNLFRSNVEWGGRLIKEDLDFFFTLGETNGVFISGNMIRLDNDFVDTLGKLRAFYEMFSAKWAKVLANRKVTEIEKEL